MPHFDEQIRGERKIREMEARRAVPVVSVILTTYNRPELLMRAIRSVKAQTFRDWELIIVDDGSTLPFDAEMFCFEVEQEVRVLALRHSGIPAVSINRGQMEARGRYVTWLCDDDEWEPSYLRTLVAALDICSLETGAEYCFSAQVDKNGKSRVIGDYGANFEKLVRKNTIPGTLIWRRELGPVFNVDPALRGYEDWECWIRLSTRTRIGCIPMVLAKHHDTSDGISRSTKAQDHFKRVAYMYDTLGPNHPLIGRYRRRALSDAFWCRFPAPWRYPFAWISRQLAGL